MSGLGERLERLGLAQYHDVFVAEGFDTWETLLDITESDLNALNVKLGHRRKLQRAIAEYRGQSTDRPLILPLSKAASIEHAYKSDDSAERTVRPPEPVQTGAPGTNTKRKYRRHPRPDENAPDRPPSAYVIFSNLVREQLKGQDLSFTEIAKRVGERWQVVDPEIRESCERQANAAKEQYYRELAVYKKTRQYESYQKYLEDFKSKHGVGSQKEGKRSRVEAEAGTTSMADHTARNSERRISSVQGDHCPTSHRHEASPPPPSGRLPSAPLYPSKDTSPAVYTMSSMTSPRTLEPYSSRAVSPRSALLQREISYASDFQPPFSRDPRTRQDVEMANSSPGYGQSQYTVPASPNPYSSRYTPAQPDFPSRRSFREPSRLPPLTHEDTTLSSESAGAHSNHSYPGLNLPPLTEMQKSRILPQLVPSIAPSQPPLDRHISPASTSTHPAYHRSLDALVRAGEIVRADEEAAGKPPETQT